MKIIGRIPYDSKATAWKCCDLCGMSEGILLLESMESLDIVPMFKAIDDREDQGQLEYTLCADCVDKEAGGKK